jgi:CheY-like chemotaxis protein
VVDDLPSMCKVLKLALARLGFPEVTLATGGEEALAAMESQALDLVICDWGMPGTGGLEVLRTVRAHPRHGGVPFLMLSALADCDEALGAFACGASDLLVKPFTTAALRDKVLPLLEPNPPSACPTAIGILTHPLATLARARSGAGARVLVVDGVAATLEILAGLLDPALSLVGAATGDQALAMAESEEPPDLILLDLSLAESDGIEVCHRLKESPLAESIPVILLSAFGDTERVVRGFAAGAVDFVAKPVHAQILNARVKTQIELKRARDELQQEVDILVANARLRDDVERIGRHDLRNPLSAIVNIVSALDTQDCCEPIREGLSHIAASAEQLLELVDLSRDLYRMETGTYRLTPRPVDLGTVLQRVARDAAVVARPRRVSIALAVAPGESRIAGEERLCASLFGNLLRNAVEASPPGGEVRVRLDPAHPGAVLVTNPGTVPAEIRSRFFEKYATSGKEGGTGLGTYSARLMTQVQGGTIGFETSESEGTRVRVALPPESG